MRICDRIHKIWLLAGIVIIGLVYVLITICYNPSLDSWRLERFKFSHSIHLNAKTKSILFWNTMWGNPTFYFGNGDFFHNCSDIGKNCWATHDRSSIKVEEFDAVLFHGSELSYLDLPKTRRERQSYVFVNLESPFNYPISYRRFDDNFFNLTMTYRLDSDVTWSYADVQSFSNGSIVAPKFVNVWNTNPSESIDLKDTSPGALRNTWNETEMIKKRKRKTKTAVWFVSNCHSKSGRNEYVKELAIHVDVDIFGSCGKEVRCPAERNCFPEVVEPDYYFYLAFENTMCQDYVTEKLYNALKHHVVPVVYGGANYNLVAPPRSYINALDFDSPRELAIYLKWLIANPSTYDKYFEWKKSYQIVSSLSRVMCQLCQYLHENNGTKSYSPLSAWYMSDKCPLQDILKSVPYITKKDLKSNR